MGEFSHVDDGTASMVDVGAKPDVYCEATASGAIELRPSTVNRLQDDDADEAQILSTARIAAIRAGKRTWDDIPMCHQVPISSVSVSFTSERASIGATVTVTSTGKTGVEMEALNGVSRALLTIWDMVKSEEKDEAGQYPETHIGEITVDEKLKGGPEE